MTTVAEVPETGELAETGEPVEALDSPAEPETGEEEEEEPEAPEEPGEAAPEGRSEKEIAKMLERLDGEAKRHANRLGEILAEDALSLMMCPLCPQDLAGWRYDRPFTDEEKELLLQLADPTRAKDYRAATQARKCDGCEGLGLVVSGSLVANRELIPCSKCNGFGYVTVAGPLTPHVLSGEAPVEAPQATAPEEAVPDVDFMGRTPDDPNFGRLPQFVR